MDDLALLAVPLAALAYVALAGAGATVALAPRFPRDAQAALSPVVGAALLAVASTLVPLGAAPRVVAVACGAAALAATLVLARGVARALRAGAVPLLVAVSAIVLAGAPALARGDWRVASLYGSTDAYHWTSQARSYLHGPAPLPVSDHPDRLTYERSKAQRWASALPFGALQIAWAAGGDPADLYSALAVLVFALLPLVAYACARACFGWRRRWAAAAALLLAGDAALLFASHFSWQQQLAGTAFVFAAVTALRLSLEPGAPRRGTALAALLAAAALASYRLGFAPYAGAIIAAVAAACAVRYRDGLGRLARRFGAFAAALGVLAAPSLAALALGFGDFYTSGGFSTGFKEAFPRGQVAEALGLVPRVWAGERGWPAPVPLAWLTVATAVAAALLVAGARAARRARLPRADFLAAGVALSIGGYLVLLLPGFAPYLSYKILAYGAPFLVLLALMPAALARSGAALAAPVALAVLAAPSAAVATAAAIDDQRTPGPLAALPSLPASAVVSVRLDDPWEQAWALYYLREQRLSVERPSFILTGQGPKDEAAQYRHRPVSYVLGRSRRGLTVWRRGDFTLVIRDRGRSGDRPRSALSLRYRGIPAAAGRSS